MKCDQNGMCFFRALLFLECVLYGTCPFWNVLFFACDKNVLKIGCPLWNVLFLNVIKNVSFLKCALSLNPNEKPVSIHGTVLRSRERR